MTARTRPFFALSLLTIAGAIAIYSLLVLFRMCLVRKERRGFGLALAATLFLFASTGFLNMAIKDAEYRSNSGEQVNLHFQPGSPFRTNHPLLHWEIRK